MTDSTTDKSAGPSLPSIPDMIDEFKTPPSEPGGWLDLLSREHLSTTLMLSMGVALFAFNGFFVSTVLPSAIAEIGGGHLIAWSVSLYLIGSIVAGVTAAQFKQRFGARRALIVATLVFLVGTLTAAFASTMEQVLLGRLGQGLGEGVVAAICYAPHSSPLSVASGAQGLWRRSAGVDMCFLRRTVCRRLAGGELFLEDGLPDQSAVRAGLSSSRTVHGKAAR
ncbi:MAG: MFS transporter [Rhizobium sp.]|nr:MFS transporter [Rhizobium sp.]